MSAKISKAKTAAKTKDNKQNVVPIDTALVAESKVEICPRDEKGRFMKGFSGNPHAWATRKLNSALALLCREKVNKWSEVLDHLITSPSTDDAVRLGALKLGLEYGFGKPLQGIDMHNMEEKDYTKFISYMAREIYEEFDLETLDVDKDAEKIKTFIHKRVMEGMAQDKIYDDVIKHIGNDYSFKNFERKHTEQGGHYKFYD